MDWTTADNPFAEAHGGLDPGSMEPAWAGWRATVPDGTFLDDPGLELLEVGPGAARARLTVARRHLNQVGVVQGGLVLAFADATAGWAAKTALAPGTSFATASMGGNVIRSAREGDIVEATASPIHLGRATMVLSVDVRLADSEKVVGAFTFTEIVLG
jgi:1,4-dihydroxy-2-naphthoyl-CoA hydrolase